MFKATVRNRHIVFNSMIPFCSKFVFYYLTTDSRNLNRDWLQISQAPFDSVLELLFLFSRSCGISLETVTVDYCQPVEWSVPSEGSIEYIQIKG